MGETRDFDVPLALVCHTYEELTQTAQRNKFSRDVVSKKEYFLRGNTVAFLTLVVVVDAITRLSAAGLHIDRIIPSKRKEA